MQKHSKNGPVPSETAQGLEISGAWAETARMRENFMRLSLSAFVMWCLRMKFYGLERRSPTLEPLFFRLYSARKAEI